MEKHKTCHAELLNIYVDGCESRNIEATGKGFNQFKQANRRYAADCKLYNWKYTIAGIFMYTKTLHLREKWAM